MKYNQAKDLKEIKEGMALVQESIEVASTIMQAELNAVKAEMEVLKAKIDLLETSVKTMGGKIDALPKWSKVSNPSTAKAIEIRFNYKMQCLLSIMSSFLNEAERRDALELNWKHS